MFAALFFSLVFTFTYATLAAKSRRWEMVLIPVLDILQSVPILGFLSFTVTFFLGLFPGQHARRGAGGDLRDLHQPGLEHGLLLLSVAAHRAARPRRGGARLPPDRLAEVLAARGALRDAGPHLEHDDVDVGRLVLRRRVGGDHGRRHDDHPARRRLLHRQGERRGQLVGDRRRDPHHGDRHSALRSAAVPADRRLGGQVPGRTVGQPGGFELLGAEPAAAHLLGAPGLPAGLRGAARHQPAADPLPAHSCRRRRASTEQQPSRILDALWILVVLAVAVWAAWLTVQLHRDGSRLGRGAFTSSS